MGQSFSTTTLLSLEKSVLFLLLVLKTSDKGLHLSKKNRSLNFLLFLYSLLAHYFSVYFLLKSILNFWFFTVYIIEV